MKKLHVKSIQGVAARTVGALVCAGAIVADAQAAPPGPPANQGVLIDAEELERWIDKGWFAGEDSCGKVVLLDVTDADSYAAGHIPGAQLWDISEQVQTRTEGPAPAVNMILDGPSMDAMIQNHGIDGDTTIVITSSRAQTYFPARAYFLFRYWGFQKKRLKVLDGFNGVWDQSQLTSVPTVCPPTYYSVKDRGMVLLDERASLSEMITAVGDGTAMPVDMRGVKNAPGSTPGVFPDGPDFVVFEGTPRGGKHFLWKNFNVDHDGGDLRWRDADDIADDLIANGIDGSKTVYSYCRTGYIGSVGYFVLDALLGWEVMTYDGSWSQWGKMSDWPEVGGELPEGSDWAVDNLELMEVINYNADAGLTVETLMFDADAHDDCPSPFLECANNVEAEDAAYVWE